MNGALCSVRQLFKWALDEALISAQAKAELTQVANLRDFRSAARETVPVRAVPDADVERAADARAARVEPMRPGEDERRRARRIADGILPRVVGDRWDTHAYARAIARVCEVEGIAHWSPNQLRHTCATEVRRRFGLALG